MNQVYVETQETIKGWMFELRELGRPPYDREGWERRDQILNELGEMTLAAYSRSHQEQYAYFMANRVRTWVQTVASCDPDLLPGIAPIVALECLENPYAPPVLESSIFQASAVNDTLQK